MNLKPGDTVYTARFEVEKWIVLSVDDSEVRAYRVRKLDWGHEDISTIPKAKIFMTEGGALKALIDAEDKDFKLKTACHRKAKKELNAKLRKLMATK